MFRRKPEEQQPETLPPPPSPSQQQSIQQPMQQQQSPLNTNSSSQLQHNSISTTTDSLTTHSLHDPTSLSTHSTTLITTNHDPTQQSSSFPTTTLQSIEYLESTKQSIIDYISPFWNSFFNKLTTSTIPELISTPIQLQNTTTLTLLTTFGLVTSLFVTKMLVDHHHTKLIDNHIRTSKHLIYYNYHTERITIILTMSKIPSISLSVPILITLHQTYAFLLEVHNIGLLSYLIATTQLFDRIFPPHRIVPDSIGSKLFTLFDSENDQQLDFYEFIQGIILLFTSPLEELFTKAYERFDMFHTNALSIDQACEIIETLNPYNNDMAQYLRITSSIRPTICKSSFVNIALQFCQDLQSTPSQLQQQHIATTSLLARQSILNATPTTNNTSTTTNNVITHNTLNKDSITMNLWNAEFLYDFASILGGDLHYNPYTRTLTSIEDGSLPSTLLSNNNNTTNNNNNTTPTLNPSPFLPMNSSQQPSQQHHQQQQQFMHQQQLQQQYLYQQQHQQQQQHLLQQQQPQHYNNQDGLAYDLYDDQQLHLHQQPIIQQQQQSRPVQQFQPPSPQLLSQPQQPIPQQQSQQRQSQQQPQQPQTRR